MENSPPNVCGYTDIFYSVQRQVDWTWRTLSLMLVLVGMVILQATDDHGTVDGLMDRGVPYWRVTTFDTSPTRASISQDYWGT